MRTVTILLTKYSDWISTLVYYICGGGYTHASLSLDGGSTYYSFNYRGFCIETPDKHRNRGVKKSLCYQVTVSDSAYQKMKGRIKTFISQRHEFSYTRLGVFFCILGIPFRWKRHYFCSQFVAEVLHDAGAIPLLKAPALYTPNDSECELERSIQLCGIVRNPI